MSAAAAAAADVTEMDEFIGANGKIKKYLETIKKIADDYNANPFPVWLVEGLSESARLWDHAQDKFAYSVDLYDLKDKPADLSIQINKALGEISTLKNDGTGQRHYALTTLLTFYLLQRQRIFLPIDSYDNIKHLIADADKPGSPKSPNTVPVGIYSPTPSQQASIFNQTVHDAWALGTLYMLVVDTIAPCTDARETKTRLVRAPLPMAGEKLPLLPGEAPHTDTGHAGFSGTWEQLTVENINTWSNEDNNNITDCFGYKCKKSQVCMMVEFASLKNPKTRFMDPIVAAFLIKKYTNATYEQVNHTIKLSDFFHEMSLQPPRQYLGGAPTKKKKKPTASAAVKAKLTAAKKKTKPAAAK